MIDFEALINSCNLAFCGNIGARVASNIRQTIAENSMESYIKKGIVIGFSGGADSVLLLIFLRNLQKELNFNLKAVHINHSIRGFEADSDEQFCREFCKALRIEFSSYKIDIPSIAKEKKSGLEETARNERYRIFSSVTESSEKYQTIATAHNASDNLETFIFNLMRGAGLHGLCGISVVRDNIIRPLIAVPKEDILKVLREANIPFVTDNTNFSTEYTRNYIRHEIIPKLKALTPIPANACSKAISNLRQDDDFINFAAEDFFNSNIDKKRIKSEKLACLHPALFSRVIRLMTKDEGNSAIEKIHIDKIRNLISSNKNFKLSLPGNISFVSRDGYCFIKGEEKNTASFDNNIILKDGINEISDLGLLIRLSNIKNEDFSSNVYKFSIQADLQSAIICGELYVRSKQSGDAYYYGGMTRKLKKLFNDKKIPLDERSRIPIICDERGIIWVPGFGVRDDKPEEKTHKFISIYKKY